MSFRPGLLLLLLPASALAQPGMVPLGRAVETPCVAALQRYGSDAHTTFKPFFREDLKDVPGTDSLLPKALWPWLDRMADPTRKLHGGPLLDALAGASLGEDEPLKYRTGAGAWVEWNPSERWTLGADAEGWAERQPDYLQQFALAYKVTPGEGWARAAGDGITHWDWNLHADYKAGEYFHFTLGKGRNFIGEGYRSLFLSDEAYGYPYLRITTTAWHIRYTNLFALMDDIRGSGGDPGRYRTKFTSMHYLSWNIAKRVNAGIFEAIVWQDNDPSYPRGFDLSYVNPVIFYRPVEYGLGSPDNALLGFALNVKPGKRSLLYSQVILDEFLLQNVRAGNGWYGNKQGVQAGVVLHDAFGQNGLMLRAEVNYVRPFLYTHSDTRQNYAHHGQPLAHPYGSGFAEGLLQGEWRQGRWLLSNVLSYAVMGRDSVTTGNGSYGNNIFLPEDERPYWQGSRLRDLGFYVGKPVLETVVQNELRAGWLVAPHSGLMLQLAWTLRVQRSDLAPVLTTNYIRAGIASNLYGPHPFQSVRR